jgi:hypothetical protein
VANLVAVTSWYSAVPLVEMYQPGVSVQYTVVVLPLSDNLLDVVDQLEGAKTPLLSNPGLSSDSVAWDKLARDSRATSANKSFFIFTLSFKIFLSFALKKIK